MTVLVTAASKHGATREIAEAIARVLDEHGVSAECVDLDKVGDLGRYEAVVLGSAVYMGQWLKEARSFIDRYARELAERPTWLFSSGPIVGDPQKPDPADEAAGIHALEAAHAREHKLFAGKVDKGKLGMLEKAAVRAAHASEGDYRDWDEIERWATEIAAQLRASTEPAPDAVEPHDAVHPATFDGPLALQHESELDEELGRGCEVSTTMPTWSIRWIVMWSMVMNQIRAAVPGAGRDLKPVGTRWDREEPVTTLAALVG